MTILRHIRNGGARLRSWEEAASFVEDFKILSIAAVSKFHLNVCLLLIPESQHGHQRSTTHIPVVSTTISVPTLELHSRMERSMSAQPIHHMFEFSDFPMSLRKIFRNLTGGSSTRNMMILADSTTRSARTRRHSQSQGSTRDRLSLSMFLNASLQSEVCRLSFPHGFLLHVSSSRDSLDIV